MKTAVVAILVFITIGISLSVIFLDQFGLERHYLFIGLGALVITSLVAFRGPLLIAMILILSLTINMPEEFLQQYYLDRDILIIIVIMMVIFPLLYNQFASGKK
jgi:hypothetical protein